MAQILKYIFITDKNDDAKYVKKYNNLSEFDFMDIIFYGRDTARGLRGNT